jgi:hypothetical protein
MQDFDDPTLVTYVIEKANGSQYEVAIPEGWRVSFGPLIPGVKAIPAASRGGTGGATLRIYETKEKQRAALTGVISFWAKDIELREVRPKPGPGSPPKAAGNPF